MIRTTITLDESVNIRMKKYCKKFGYTHSGLISFLLLEKMGDFDAEN